MMIDDKLSDKVDFSQRIHGKILDIRLLECYHKHKTYPKLINQW